MKNIYAKFDKLELTWRTRVYHQVVNELVIFGGNKNGGVEQCQRFQILMKYMRNA